MVRRMVLHGLAALGAIALIFVASPRAFAGDTDTARNYLSTIVSCLSTIFALCISITLVAIQMTASRYTHRVLDLFLKMPYNVSLTVVYFVTIIQSLYLLSHITEPIHETLPSYLQPQMNADMALVIACFGMLVLYMFAVMRLIKPERIVGEIHRECRLALARGRETEARALVEQICDVAKRAAADLDSTTGLIAVRVLEELSLTAPASVRRSVLRQFVEIAGIAAKEREGGMLAVVLASLKRAGETAVQNGAADDARNVVDALAQIARGGLIGQQMAVFAEMAVDGLYGMALLALSRTRPGVPETADRADEPDEMSGLVCSAFCALTALGRMILRTEPEGASYVARAVLGPRFGALLQRAFTRREKVRARELVSELSLQYIGLSAELMETARARDAMPLYRWLKTAGGSGRRGPAADQVRAICALLGALAQNGQAAPVVPWLSLASVAHPWPAAALEDMLGCEEELDVLFCGKDARQILASVRVRTWPE